MSIIKKKYKVVDLFAGAGGFGLGFTMGEDSPYELVCSVEKDKWAAETLMANSTHKIVLSNIEKFKTKQSIRQVCKEIPDIIIGGPPCQGFSYASGKKDPSDPRNSLFKYFAKWVNTLGPQVFVMENVKGLLNGHNEKGEKVIDIIEQTFKKIGYSINIWVLNAANYGVPQIRERIFIVGYKGDIKITPPAITHYLPSQINMLGTKIEKLTPAITVWDAIGDLPSINAGEGAEEQIYEKEGTTVFQNESRTNSLKVYNHVAMNHTKRVVHRYENIINGVAMSNIPDESKVRKRNGNGELSESVFSSNYRHLKPDMISYTIPASFYSNFVHPYKARNITTREAARIQSFPDYYVFKGKRTQISSKLLMQLGKEDENHLSQYNQVGNAVPPLLAKAISKRIHEFLQEQL